jgi:hypothetical protein
VQEADAVSGCGTYNHFKKSREGLTTLSGRPGTAGLTPQNAVRNQEGQRGDEKGRGPEATMVIWRQYCAGERQTRTM